MLKPITLPHIAICECGEPCQDGESECRECRENLARRAQREKSTEPRHTIKMQF